MTFKLVGSISFFILVLAMLVLLEIGRRIGLSVNKEHPGSASSGVGPVETIIFGLLGLLIAFTFTGAESRFESRRQLITLEANAIGTSYLRVSLLPENLQPQVRELFKQYVKLRSSGYQNLDYKLEKINTVSNQVSELQNKIWLLAINGCKQTSSNSCSMLLIPALNDMFDITTLRFMATKNHPPVIVYFLLLAIGLFGALLVGYNLSGVTKRNILYMLTYAIIISLLIYLIVDLELPRFGFVRIDSTDQVIADLLKGM
jgi:hypothetical protein